MKYSKVLDVLKKIAPDEYAVDWDNSGVQIHTGREEIRRILFCLEINDDVIQEAEDKSADMIVTHHPLLFRRPDSIDIDTVQGRYIVKLVQKGISVYSAHITFDSAPRGNNWYLASLIGLSDIEMIDGEIGVRGKTDREITLREAACLVSEKLDIDRNQIKIAGDPDLTAVNIAICTGAGCELLYALEREDCQILITGEVKLNVAQDCAAMGMGIIDAGHYGTEKIFAENFMKQFMLTVFVS